MFFFCVYESHELSKLVILILTKLILTQQIRKILFLNCFILQLGFLELDSYHEYRDWILWLGSWITKWKASKL